MRSPIGGIPGIEPGQMALGHSSACAGAPSSTGGIFNIDSSSVGNLKPASLKALPKSLSLGKSRWQVLQEVLYSRENAGMAKLRGGITRAETTNVPKISKLNSCCLRMLLSLLANAKGSQ